MLKAGFMKKSFWKFLKGFTLAEIMIVLTIIGVLAGILVPIAVHSRPDDKVMKFKKADTTLKNVIRELVNSDKYYVDGDLGIRRLSDGTNQPIDGTHVGDKSYFCNTFADVVSAKSNNCNDMEEITPTSGLAYGGTIAINGEEFSEAVVKAVDNVCDGEYSKTTEWKKCNSSVTTTDGITYTLMGACDPFGSTNVNYGGKRTYITKGTIDTEWRYKFFCIDIDEIHSGEDAFGYGLRYDGKIFLGKRAKEWLEKDFQKGKNDN